MILQGKTVLITGGSKGIGGAVVEAMAKEGANVIINYSHDAKAADAMVKKVTKNGVVALAVKADIANAEEVVAMFAEIKTKFSAIDVVVNNAALFDEHDNPDSLEAFQNVFNTDFLAQVRITNEARKLMKTGKIIFVSSIHGKLGHGRPTAIAYSAMKAALDSYMKNLAKALAPGILVNSVAPGKTLTPMWGEMDEDYKSKQAADQLINGWIDPSEIADGIVFLAKNDAVCGEVLVIDGGMSLKVLG